MVTRTGHGDGPSGGLFSPVAIVKGTFLSFSVTFASAVLLGFAVSLTEWEGVSEGAQWFSFVSIALGGMLAAKNSRHMGWMHGGLVGLAYFLISAALFQSGFSWNSLLTSAWVMRGVWSFTAGALGGILGVNT